MAQSKSYKRTKYFVKRDLQTKYAFMFVLSIGVGLNLGVILTLLAPMMQKSSPIYPILYIILVLSCIALVAGISILFTHKIAGPIYKIERSFRHIIDERDLSLRVYLRTGDELQELSEEINRLLDHFRNSLVIENQKIEAILAKADYAIESLESVKSPEKKKALAQLIDLRQKLQETGLNYKLQ